MRIKRNVKYIFRLITRRRVLGMLGLFGGFTYSFIDTTSITESITGIGVEKRSVETPDHQKFFNPSPIQTGSNQFDENNDGDAAEAFAGDELAECPYETDQLSKLFKSSLFNIKTWFLKRRRFHWARFT